MEINCLKEIILEKYQLLKQDYDSLSQHLIEKDEVIQKLQEFKRHLELEISPLQKFDKVASSPSSTLDDVDDHNSSHAFVTPIF